MITEFKCDKCKHIYRGNYTEHYDKKTGSYVQYCIKCSVDYEIADLNDSILFCRKEIEDAKNAINENILKISQICNGNLASVEFKNAGEDLSNMEAKDAE